jgi:hypothetical protein
VAQWAVLFAMYLKNMCVVLATVGSALGRSAPAACEPTLHPGSYSVGGGRGDMLLELLGGWQQY